MKKTGGTARRTILILISVVFFLPGIASAGGAQARLKAVDLFPAEAVSGDCPQTVRLAAARTHAHGEVKARMTPPISSFSTARAHRFMGYGTIALAGLAAASNSDHDLHRVASYAALWLAGATCATGFSGHQGAIDLSDGLSAYDTHALLGSLGTIGFAATLALAEADDDDSSHGGLGAASAAAMGLSVIIVNIKW
jgi:ammonia channel protein AmtB